MRLPKPLFNEITSCADARHGGRESERRSLVRIGISVPIQVMRRLNGEWDEPIKSRLRDISLGALGLLLREAILPGEEFAARLPRRKSGFVWIRCLSLRCSNVDKNLFLIGAQFISIIETGEALDISP